MSISRGKRKDGDDRGYVDEGDGDEEYNPLYKKAMIQQEQHRMMSNGGASSDENEISEGYDDMNDNVERYSNGHQHQQHYSQKEKQNNQSQQQQSIPHLHHLVNGNSSMQQQQIATDRYRSNNVNNRIDDHIRTSASRFSKRDQNWDAQYEALIAYGNKHGHCNVKSGPTPGEDEKVNLNLYAWLALQRRQKKLGKLRIDREKKLQYLVDQGKLLWAQPESKAEARQQCNWDDAFDEILIYCDIHGHANIPLSTYVKMDGKNIDLGAVIHEKRMDCENGIIYKGHLDDLKILALEGKFQWTAPTTPVADIPLDVLNNKWNARFAAVASFARSQPAVCMEDKISATLYTSGGEMFDLGTWIRTQRKKKQKGILEEDRVEKLNTLVADKCFCWITEAEAKKLAEKREKEQRDDDTLWNAWYNVLVYHGKHFGHCNLSYEATIGLPDGSEAELGKWLYLQRSAMKKGKLRIDRAHKMKALLDNGKLEKARWQNIFSIRYPSLCDDNAASNGPVNHGNGHNVNSSNNSSFGDNVEHIALT